MQHDRPSPSRPAFFTQVAILLCTQTQLTHAGTYSAAVLADNPTAYYQLDEITGNTALNSGSAAGINGTYVNIPGVTANNTSNYGQPGPRTPSFIGFEANNNAIFLDPEDNSTATSDTFPRVEVPVADGSNPLAITGALTLEAWINRSEQTLAPSNNEGIVGRYRQDGDPNTSGNQAGRAYVLYFDSATDGTLGTPDGTPGLGFALSTDGNFQSANSYEFAADIPVDVWTHVALVYDPGQRIEAYVNGESIATITTDVLNSPLFSGMSDFWIGQQFTGADEWSFEGSIDEVAVYGAALSDEQIAAHYVAAIPEPTTWLLATVAMGLVGTSRRRAMSHK